MALQIEQPALNIREELVKNKKRYGLNGKQLIESETLEEARRILNVDRKNLIINGNFNIWQKGNGPFVINSNNNRQLDQWITHASGGIGGLTKEDGYISVDCTIGNNNFSILQRLEDIRKFSNKYITISFKYRLIGKDIELRTIRSVDNVFSMWDDRKFNIDVSANWTSFTVTTYFDKIPDGWVLADTNILQLSIGQRIIDVSTTPFKLDIKEIQVEFGTEATEFEQRSYGEELELCRRYVRLSDVNTRVAQYSHEMRTTPTVSGALAPYLYEAEL